MVTAKRLSEITKKCNQIKEVVDANLKDRADPIHACTIRQTAIECYLEGLVDCLVISRDERRSIGDVYLAETEKQIKILEESIKKKICKNCKSWRPENIACMCSNPAFVYTGKGDEHPANGLGYGDQDSDRAYLTTGPGFGCMHFN